MMIRTVAICLVLLGSAATARAAQDTAEIGLSTPPSVSVEQQRAVEIDKLFGELHKDPAGSSRATVEKIWALWTRNDSAMAEVLLTQSDKALKDGAFETSEQMLNELLGSYPDYTQALNTRAMLYYNMKRYDDALIDIEAVLEKEPRHFGALSGLAAVSQAQGNVARAAQALRDAIAVNPTLDAAKDALKQLEHDYPNI